jgi:hypothetical protein
MAAEINTRRFNVGDALVLIAALCTGLAGIRDRIRTLPQRTLRWIEDYRQFRNQLGGTPPMSPEDYQFAVQSLVFYLSDEGRTWLSSSLIGLTGAQVVMRLRRPRPDWQTLSRQPGFLACCSAIIGYCLNRGWVPFVRFESLEPPLLTALGVVVAWSVLRVSRRWKPEGSWLDRLGIVVGIGWIAAETWSLLEQSYLW